MRNAPYILLDVFTQTPFTGNQLAVFTDGRNLSDVEMQALAKETNLAETTFIIPRDPAVEKANGIRVRIFTVDEELPFAGHPTLGTATCTRNLMSVPANLVELELGVGKIPVTFEAKGNGLAFGEMRQRDPEFGQQLSREDVARVAGLDLADIRDDLPIQTVSTGLPFAIVPVRSLNKMHNLGFTWKAAKEFLEKTDAKFLYFVCTETEDAKARLHARMVFYNGDDPATGSAAGCAAAWMAKYGVAASGERVMIEQGIEIKRPSQIFVSAQTSGERVIDVRVGGYAVEVAHGEFQLP